MVGNSEPTQLASVQREVAHGMRDVSSARRLGHSVRGERVRHIDGTPPEHPHNDRHGEAGRQPACSEADVDAERHIVHPHTGLSNVSHGTGYRAAETMLHLLLLGRIAVLRM